VVVTKAVDAPGARLVHDPTQDRSVGRIVPRRSAPNRMECVHGQLLGGPAVVEKSGQEGEDESVCPLVKSAQGALITGGNRTDERNPLFFRYARLRAVCIEQVTKVSGHAINLVPLGP
jgi:hypothetical protein